MLRSTNLTLTLLILFFSSILKSQSFKPKAETAICRYFFVAENDVYLNLGISSKTNSAIMFQKDDEKARSFMLTSLKMIVDSINKNTSLTLLPVNTLKGKVTYSRTGFPLSSLKKASKKSDHKQFVSVDIFVSGTKTNTTTRRNVYETSDEDSKPPKDDEIEAELGHKNTGMNFFPRVQVKLKFADSEGKASEKYTGTYTHNKRVYISTDIAELRLVDVGGSMEFGHILNQEATNIPFFAFLASAIEDLVKKIPQK